MKIIVIEDDANYAELVRHALDGLATSVQVFHNWEEARYAIEQKPNVLWIDLAVTGVTFDDVTRNIGNARKDAELIIVVASGFLDAKRRKELEIVGVDFMDDKQNRIDPLQIASLIVLGILKAKRRGSKSAAALLDRALEFMHARFPDSVVSL